VIRRLMAPTANKKLRSEKVKGGSCMVYLSIRPEAKSALAKRQTLSLIPLTVIICSSVRIL
jgi:hypothetical protein